MVSTEEILKCGTRFCNPTDRIKNRFERRKESLLKHEVVIHKFV